jgi:hypothetical protein
MYGLVTLSATHTTYSDASSWSADSHADNSPHAAPVPEDMTIERPDTPMIDVDDSFSFENVFTPSGECSVCCELVSQVQAVDFPGPSLQAAILEHFHNHNPYIDIVPDFRIIAGIVVRAQGFTILQHHTPAVRVPKPMDDEMEIEKPPADFEYSDSDSDSTLSEVSDVTALNPDNAKLKEQTQQHTEIPPAPQDEFEYSDSESASTLTECSNVTALLDKTEPKEITPQELDWQLWEEIQAEAAPFEYLRSQEEEDPGDDFVQMVARNQRIHRWVLAVEPDDE